MKRKPKAGKVKKLPVKKLKPGHGRGSKPRKRQPIHRIYIGQGPDLADLAASEAIDPYWGNSDD